MCTREELRTLLYELILRVDQVAFLSAKYQLNDELCFGTANPKVSMDNFTKTRFQTILRFQRAYLRYFVFAGDPLANFIVPLPPSSLTLFISNILADIHPNITMPGCHTTNSIISFLRFTNSELVDDMLTFYRKELEKMIKEMRLPYNIETLGKIRHDCHQQCHSKPKMLSKLDVAMLEEGRKLLFNKLVRYPMKPAERQYTEKIVVEFVPVAPANEQIPNPIVYSSSAIPSQMIDASSYQPFQVILATNATDGRSLSIPSEVIELALENRNQKETKMTMDMGKSDSLNNVSGVSSNPSQISSHQLCAGCGKPIQDRYLLKALDMLWHEDCLKCGCCDCRLGEVGSTLYTKGNLMLCKRDYLRLFGNTGMCAACNKVIPAFEMVMRARNNVYHLECFACQQCNHRFCVGDRFYLCENKILCEYDYEERMVFASIGNHPMMKRHITNVGQNAPPPPYSKNAGNMPNGAGPIGNNVNGVAGLQQQHSVMAMDHSPHHHSPQHIPQSKLQQHDDHNNNNNSHGPANGGNCGMNANQFNAPLMKIPHSA